MVKKPKKPVKPVKPIKPRPPKPNHDDDKYSIIPTIKRYFHIPENDIDLTNGVQIAATQFFNDSGKNVMGFTTYGKNGYTNLYVNGVMQQGDLYKVKQNSLWIIPNNAKILAGTPIIVESVGFTIKI